MKNKPRAKESRAGVFPAVLNRASEFRMAGTDWILLSPSEELFSHLSDSKPLSEYFEHFF